MSNSDSGIPIDALNNASFFNDTCGQDKDCICDCFDCETYFKKDIARPIQNKDMADEKFKELLELCKRKDVIDKMKEERYRTYAYQQVPYPLWHLLQNKDQYNRIISDLKDKMIIPDEEPIICRIGTATMCGLNGHEEETNIVYYRFQTSTVKFELSITFDENHIKLRTYGRGSEY